MSQPTEPTPGAPAGSITPAAPATASASTTPAAPPAATPAAAPPWERDGQTFDPDRAWKLIESLRSENTTLKQGRQQDQQATDKLTADMKRLLGIGDTQDPNLVAQQLQAAQDAAWASKVELTLYKQAGGLGANPAALLDSMTFIQSLDDIEAEPGTPEFDQQLAVKVQEAMDRNPNLKAGQASASPPPRFAAGADGGTRAGTSVPQLTESDLRRMSPEQIVAAQEKGQLNDLLGIK